MGGVIFFVMIEGIYIYPVLEERIKKMPSDQVHTHIYLMSKFERCIASCILSDISMGSTSTMMLSELSAW
jgi:hypothetical protein